MSFLNFQYISLHLTISTLFLAVSHGVPYIDSQRKNTIQNRNFVQFGSLVLDAIGNPLAYNGYGCWCGKGSRGDLVVDETDRCCETHDNCWGSVEKDFPSCDPFWRVYSYKKTSNGNVQCNDPVGTCDYDTCQCDKAAVECFASHRNTSYDPDFDNWKGLCTKTSKPSEVDPEQCPPVWNNREKYPRDGLVSINGIVYQSLHTSTPGANPKDHLRDSHIAGTVATWKKLGLCRRTNNMKNF